MTRPCVRIICILADGSTGEILSAQVTVRFDEE